MFFTHSWMHHKAILHYKLHYLGLMGACIHVTCASHSSPICWFWVLNKVCNHWSVCFISSLGCFRIFDPWSNSSEESVKRQWLWNTGSLIKKPPYYIFFVWPYTGAFFTQRMHSTGLGITELPHEQLNNTANTNVLLDNTREFFVNIQLPSPHKDIH